MLQKKMNKYIEKLQQEAIQLIKTGVYSDLDKISECRADILALYSKLSYEAAVLETEYDLKKHQIYVEIKKRYKKENIKITENEASTYARAKATNEHKIIKQQANIMKHTLEELRSKSILLLHEHKVMEGI